MLSRTKRGKDKVRSTGGPNMNKRILTTFLLLLLSLFYTSLHPQNPITPEKAEANNKISGKISSAVYSSREGSGSNTNSSGTSSVIILTKNIPSSSLKDLIGKVKGKVKKQFRYLKAIAVD